MHVDDTTLPMFLRSRDENSTMSLPRKVSNYLEILRSRTTE